MNKEKMKQYFKDYLDFAMPLIMVIVALNLVDLFIDLPYYYKNHSATKFGDLFEIRFYLSVFMDLVDSYIFIIGSFIVLCVTLFLRLFTNRIYPIFLKPFEFIIVGFFIFWMLGMFGTGKWNLVGLAFWLIFLFILGFLLTVPFCILKIFFANFPKIKNIAYIVVSILIVLFWVSYYFALSNMPNNETLNIADNKMIYFIKWILLIVTLSLIVVSAIGYLVLEILEKVFKKGNLIIPNDITEWVIDAELEAEAEREARIQKRERNRIINDIADEVRKRL